MAHQTQVWQVLLFNMRKEILATIVIQPETQKGRAGRQDEVADGVVGTSCCDRSVW
jgi:hypothetical protein